MGVETFCKRIATIELSSFWLNESMSCLHRISQPTSGVQDLSQG